MALARRQSVQGAGRDGDAKAQRHAPAGRIIDLQRLGCPLCRLLNAYRLRLGDANRLLADMDFDCVCRGNRLERLLARLDQPATLDGGEPGAMLPPQPVEEIRPRGWGSRVRSCRAPPQVACRLAEPTGTSTGRSCPVAAFLTAPSYCTPYGSCWHRGKSGRIVPGFG